MKLEKDKQSDAASIKSNSGQITPLTHGDLEQVAQMSQKYFPASKNISISSLKDTMEEFYFKAPDRSPHISPLVSRTADGEVTGFLGITTIPFLYKDEEITVANCHHLMATEEARSKLIPMRMLQQFLAGPQDFSFSDGSVETTRHLWKRLGGAANIVNSLYYKVPLRPVSFSARPFLKNLNKPLRTIIQVLARGTDAVGGAVRLPLFHRTASGARLIPLDADLFIEAINKVKKNYSLFPRYDKPRIERIFQLLDKEKRYGKLYKFAIVDNNDHLIGWFIYYAKRGAVCEVIQAVSMPGKESELFDHLVQHAFARGGIELSGRLMPHQLRSPFTRKAVTMPARMWTLLHSTRSDLMLEMQSGNSFLTRLEGDLWLL